MELLRLTHWLCVCNAVCVTCPIFRGASGTC
jgi:hypothetical protein